ncbi:MAG: OsmC family peroxiredoxin, partial [Acidimicrobiales bacterium]
MPARTSEAEWAGDLEQGAGTLTIGNKVWSGPYSYRSRFLDESGANGTNPEELIGAAHAGCFSMALSAALAKAGHTATRVQTSATVRLEKLDAGFAITRIDLRCEAEVPGIDEES